MNRRLGPVLGLCVLLAPGCALEGGAIANYSSAPLKYSFALPPKWKVTSRTGSEDFFSRIGEEAMGCSVGTIPESTPLSAPGVPEHIDLDRFSVTEDEMVRQGDEPGRRIRGTAMSEGTALEVISISVKRDDGARIVQMTIWGTPWQMKHAGLRREVDSMISSFRSTP